MRPPTPPAPPPPNLDWTMSFMMVIPALLTASCLFPLAEPPDESNNLEASAMAREIMSDLEPDLPPLVNCCKIYRAIGSSDSGLNHRAEGWQWVELYLQGSGTAHGICAHSIRRPLLVDLPVSLCGFILVDRFVMLSCFPGASSANVL